MRLLHRDRGVHPAPVTNLPGLQAISYRAGTHAMFLASMLANLSLLADSGALADLRARDDGDLAIALLDAWAAVADVHTFYSERIASENYLRRRPSAGRSWNSPGRSATSFRRG